MSCQQSQTLNLGLFYLGIRHLSGPKLGIENRIFIIKITFDGSSENYDRKPQIVLIQQGLAWNRLSLSYGVRYKLAKIENYHSSFVITTSSFN